MKSSRKNSKKDGKKSKTKKPAGRLNQQLKSVKKKQAEKDKLELITQTEFAKRLGISKQAVSAYVKNGTITLVKKKIDYERSLRELRENTDPQNLKKIQKKPALKISKSDENEIEDFAKSKKIRESYKAKLAELEYKIKIKEYVKASDVEKAAFEFARKLRDKLLNIPERIAAEFAAETGKEMSRVRKILLREIEIALQGV